MMPLAHKLLASRRSLVAAMLSVQVICLPAIAQDFPNELGLPEETAVGDPNVEQLPGPLGDKPAPGSRPLVVDIVIQGAQNEDRILNQIRTKREFEYDPVQLQADVRRLITSGYYRNVKTYLRNVDEGVVVIFEVVERPKINSLEFLGNRGFADKKLIKVVNLKVGEPLNTYEVEEGRRKLEEHYRTKGYPRAEVGILDGDKPEDQAVAYVISEGYMQRISAVTFEGNTFASDGQLKTKIESKPGILWVFLRGKFDRAKLDADVEKLTAYYRDFGFFRARIGRTLEFDESGKWVTVKFIIDEGPRYNVRNVSIVGNETLLSQPILDAFELKAGMPYDRLKMDKDRTLVQDLYGSRGQIFAEIEATPRFLEEPGQIDLVYKIKEGEPFRVGQINVHIEGEFPHTRRNVVLNRMSLRPGDLIDIREIRNSERRLKASQLFESEATGGEPPRIVVRPPELKDAAGLVGTSGGTAVRGQSPDSATKRLPPVRDVDVFLPADWIDQAESSPNAVQKAAYNAPVTNETRRLPPVD